MCRDLFLILVALTVAQAAGAQSCFKAPSAAALNLYNEHQQFIFEGGSSPPLSAKFAAIVNDNIQEEARTGDVGAIDWDYWTGAQDGKPSPNASVASVSVHGGSARVLLKYQFFPSPGMRSIAKTALVTVSRDVAGCWLVEDVARGKTSVRSLLTGRDTTRGRQL